MWFTSTAVQIPFQLGMLLVGAGLAAQFMSETGGERVGDLSASSADGDGAPDVVDDPVVLGTLVVLAVAVAGWVFVQLRPWLLVAVVTLLSVVGGGVIGVVHRSEECARWRPGWSALVGMTAASGALAAQLVFAPAADPLGLRDRWEGVRRAGDTGITVAFGHDLDVAAFVGVQFFGVVLVTLGMLLVGGAAVGLLAHEWARARPRGAAAWLAASTQRVWSHPGSMAIAVGALFVVALLMVSGVAQSWFLAWGS